MDGASRAEIGRGYTTLVVGMYTDTINQNEKPDFARRVQGQATGVGGRGADAAEWVRKALGFEADETQQEILRSDKQRGLLNCTRQWGKSTVTAAKAIHQAYHYPESLTLVVSPSARQSGGFLRKAR